MFAYWLYIAWMLATNTPVLGSTDESLKQERLTYHPLPALPDPIGVAGPIVGVSGEWMLVAGGANFGLPNDKNLWDLPKKYHTKSWLLKRLEDKTEFKWISSDFCLSEPVAYASTVSTEKGVLVFGGENEAGLTNRAYLLSIEKEDTQHVIAENDLAIPNLPQRCTAGGAARLGDYVYVVAGQVADMNGNNRASRIVWRLHLPTIWNGLDEDNNNKTEMWQQIPEWPVAGPRRMHCQVVVQHDGFGDRLYVIGGRRFLDGANPSDLRKLQPTQDGWVFDPTSFDQRLWDPKNSEYHGRSPWKQIANSPVPLTAGTAVAYGPGHILIPTGATLDILKGVVESGIEMKDFQHPGFPKKSYAYHTITDTWIEFSSTPSNQVTTPAVRWGDDIFLVSGEVRPRVRTNQVWRIEVNETKRPFGPINMIVLVSYLILILGIGIRYTWRNESTDDYFRGGKQIPWWAAGCSIFATMLSSITYMAIPAKAYAQDWVYWIGSFLILAVAPIAIYLALPFFRRIDATSAYEYLEKRFNRAARWIGSGSFSLFHVFRMGVVLALAAMALSSVTPFTPQQSVVIMGVLSLIYCTLGGVEAVIWTDTVQTFILLAGALLCFGCAWLNASTESFSAVGEAGKLHLVNLDFGSDSFTIMALWVVIIGGLGQNISSYTADQAVVQRYMTTSNESLAARAIWLNGLMAIPASAIFFAMGTAFWMFYRSHPEKLDPTIATDRIMPLFISQGIADGARWPGCGRHLCRGPVYSVDEYEFRCGDHCDRFLETSFSQTI